MSPLKFSSAAQTQTETGPLEALLAELEFNRIAVNDGTQDENFPVLATEQFRRAIATNALAALVPSVRESFTRLRIDGPSELPF